MIDMMFQTQLKDDPMLCDMFSIIMQTFWAQSLLLGGACSHLGGILAVLNALTPTI